MTSVKTHGTLTVGTVTIRRKPTLTYQSPAQSTALSHPENSQFTSRSVTTPPLPTESPPTRLSQIPELSQRSTITHQSSRHHMTTLLPLYHPFGTLALALPDLDPTAFGLPAPVAVFDDPTRRLSNRQRRPAAKVRDADDPVTSHPPSHTAATPTPESEVREKPSPRRRRGGGPGGRRRRREPEDGDATYPAKRPRMSRSAGIASGLSGTRTLSREEGSPTLSNTHSRASPDLAEEKKPERRSTRSRGAIVRRNSTTSEETTTSTSPPASATNAAVSRVASNEEQMETDEPASNDASNEITASESKNADPGDAVVHEKQENSCTNSHSTIAGGSM